ncbi:hypothetical protein Fmac_002414 [Flemingia macrophylla]|uniref:B3 domain-containing protein n=1 Tax=Flemingia macrophylla TaxID=520843 RepID=A0ABD1NJV9_9FABA
MSRDIQTLQKLLASSSEELKKVSNKPFHPNALDVVVLRYAPHFYNEEEKLQINNFKQGSSVESTSETNSVTGKSNVQEMLEEEEEEERIIPINKRPKKEISSPHLPAKFKNLNLFPEDDIKFVMHKRLFSSDVDPYKNRLSMPKNGIACDFLTKAEVTKLSERDGKNQLVGVEVTVLDPCLREFSVLLKKWDMDTTHTYNLSGHWKNIVSINKFEKDQELKIWTCRVNNRLYFLLVYR